MKLRCFKHDCHAKPENDISQMPGVHIHCCPKHRAEAIQLAANGRL